MLHDMHGNFQSLERVRYIILRKDIGFHQPNSMPLKYVIIR